MFVGVYFPNSIGFIIQQHRRVFFFYFVRGVEGEHAYFVLSSVFKLHTLMDVVVILSLTYLTNSRVSSVLACSFPESLDVLKALSFLLVYWR